MIRGILTGLFCLFALSAQSQVLRDINYNYRYDPNGLCTFTWKVIKVADNSYKVYYKILPNDTTQDLKDLSVQLEMRVSTSEKNGVLFHDPPASKQSGALFGFDEFKVEQNQNIIVAKITLTVQGKPKTYIFHKPLPKNASLILLAGGLPVTNSFIGMDQSITFEGSATDKPIQISRYAMVFPQAAPAFSTAQAKVAKVMKTDSTFTVNATTPITFTKKGLYLAQHDTASTEGIAFRVEADYPKLGRLESLAGPLTYICEKQEIEKLKQAGNDKKKFDQIILNITGNPERARTFMRSYFKRVEFANLYFTSYKDGWKTDRGMIYIIFGVPEEVYLFEDREVWEYNDETKIRFQFIKSPTLFDPDNYVLVREKKYTDPWLKRVDLLRKARF